RRVASRGLDHPPHRTPQVQGRTSDQAASRQVRRHGRLLRGLMPQTVEVRFKGSRRAFYSWAHDTDPLQRDEPVVVAAERGFDLGWVHSAGAQADQKCGGCSGCSPGTEEAEAAPYPAITRRALPGEVSQ